MKHTPPHPVAAMADKAEAAANLLKQLANARRLMALCSLVTGEKSAGDLAEICGLSHSALSQHLTRLRADMLVTSEKRGQHVYYQLASAEVQALLSTLYLIFCRTT